MGYDVQILTLRVRCDGEPPSDQLASTPNSAAEVIRSALYDMGADADVEHFGVLALDSRHRMIGFKLCHTGTSNAANVEPRKVWQTAMMLGSAGIIIFHTHPSGNMRPSRDDLELTKRFAKMGTLLGIPVHDHLILSGRRVHVSLRSTNSEVFAS